MAKKLYYLCFVTGGNTDFGLELEEPFESEEARLEKAKEIWQADDLEEDGETNLFWLDIVDGKPILGSFSDLDDDEEYAIGDTVEVTPLPHSPYPSFVGQIRSIEEDGTFTVGYDNDDEGRVCWEGVTWAEITFLEAADENEDESEAG